MNSLNRTAYLTLCSLLTILFFITYSHSATAEDWECEDIHANVTLVKVNADPAGVLGGSWTGGGIAQECGIIGALDDGTGSGSVSFVVPAEQTVFNLSLSLDVSQLQAQHLESVTFAALETGGGYDQTPLVELALQPAAGASLWQVQATWYTAGNVSRSDILAAVPVSGSGLVDIEILWLDQVVFSSALVTVLQTTASSSFVSGHTASPSVVRLGVMQPQINAAAGSFAVTAADLLVE